MADIIVVATDLAPQAIGPYSQAVRAGDTFYISGQLGIEPASGKMVSPETAAQARQALENIRAILQKAGLSMQNVVQVQIFMTDIADFAAVNLVYKEFFSEPYPARAAVGVATLPAGGKIEILATAKK